MKLAALVLALLASTASAEPPPSSKPAAAQAGTWFAQALTSSVIGPTVTYFWSKGRSLRSLTIVHGHPVVTLVHGGWYYVVDELEGKGLAVERSPRAIAEDAQGGRPFAREADIILAEGAERVATEQLGSMRTHVYRLTDGVAKREVWIPAEGERLPLQVEVFDRALKQTRRIQYMGWTRELEIPDRFFEPDPRLALERVSYADYLQRAKEGPVGSLPILYGELLHGARPEGP